MRFLIGRIIVDYYAWNRSFTCTLNLLHPSEAPTDTIVAIVTHSTIIILMIEFSN